MKLIQQIVHMLTADPKALFLLDGIGAMLSALLLGIVFVGFESIFGMPVTALYILAIIPCTFLAYDLLCYFLGKGNWSNCIKVIAIANLLYCGISISAVIYHFQELTLFGLAYFMLEVIVILVLVRIELRVAGNLSLDSVQS